MSKNERKGFTRAEINLLQLVLVLGMISILLLFISATPENANLLGTMITEILGGAGLLATREMKKDAK